MDTPERFVVDFNQSSTYAFNGLTQNYFVEKILKNRNDKKSNQLYFRIFRTGLIGDILYRKASECLPTEEHSSEMELLAGLFESYMFLVRSIYDYLLYILKEKYGVTENSFNKFIKNVEKGNYPEIEGKFRDHLLNNSLFEEIRALRDSIKRQTPYVFVYVKENSYWVDGTIYKRDGTKEYFDESLHVKIFSYTTALLLLMAYITENVAGVGFKEQTEYLKNKYRD